MDKGKFAKYLGNIRNLFADPTVGDVLTQSVSVLEVKSSPSTEVIEIDIDIADTETDEPEIITQDNSQKVKQSETIILDTTTNFELEFSQIQSSPNQICSIVDNSIRTLGAADSENSTNSNSKDKDQTVLKGIANIHRSSVTKRRRSRSTRSNFPITETYGTMQQIKDQKVQDLRKAMEEMSEKIKAMEEEEVDLDDEDNSAFIKLQEGKRKLATAFYTFCDAKNTSKFTGRWMQKKCVINNVLSLLSAQIQSATNSQKFKKMEEAVTRFANSKLHKLKSPTFWEIQSLVNTEAKKLGINYSGDELLQIAEGFHKVVVDEIKERRKKDQVHAMVLPKDFSYAQDPANFDSQLERKLAENQKIAHNLKDMDNKFVELFAPEANEKETEELRGTDSEFSSDENDENF